MPPAEGGTAGMKCDCFRHVDPSKSPSGAANAEVDIFQIGLELDIQQSDAIEQFRTKNRSGKRGEPDLTRLIPQRRIRTAVSTAPRTRPSANGVERAVDPMSCGSIQQFARGKPGVDGF